MHDIHQTVFGDHNIISGTGNINTYSLPKGDERLVHINCDKINIVLDTGHNLYKWDRGSMPRLSTDYQTLSTISKQKGHLVIEKNLGDFSFNTINEIDLIILVNPKDCYYTQIEIDHLVQFVRSGGNLLILAYYWWKSDHDSNVDVLAAKFGIYLQDDRIYDPKQYNENEYRPLCTCLIQQLTNKPIIVPFCCSMHIEDNVEPVLVTSNDANSDKVKLVDRRIVRRFETAETGTLITAARVKVKRGQVFVLGSWETFLDEIMNESEYGNCEFMKGVLAWLKK